MSGEVISNPAVTAAAGAAVVAIVIPLIQSAAADLSQRYYDFGKDEMQEIKYLRELYRNHCFKLESESTLTTRFPGLEGEGENNRDFPIYFQMDPDREKQPMFFKKKFKTIMEAEAWNRFVFQSDLSDVSGGIKDMIGHICNYQNERNKGLAMITEKHGIGGKGYYYDPTNLFFEEFKRWLVELSKAPLDERTLQIVEGRMNYLRKIDVNEVFKQSHRILTRRETVIKLLNNLSETVRPMILSTIAAQGSREHYDNLKKNINGLIRQTAKFCFYIFRDTEGTPINFILEEIEKGGGNYKKILTETRTGRLLQRLYNCPLYKLIRDSGHVADLSQYSLEFSGEMDALLLESCDEYKKMSWGILPEFQEATVLSVFYKLHGLIEKLYVFQKISNDLYSLSGKGGDILVYGYLAPQTQEVMQHYRSLLRELELTIRDLHAIADKKRHELIGKKEAMSRTEQRWVVLFRHADEAYEQICYRWSRVTDEADQTFSLIGESVRLVRKIEEKMDEINTPQYREQLQNEIKKFSRWMVLFTGRDVLPSAQTTQITQTSMLEALNSPGSVVKANGRSSGLIEIPHHQEQESAHRAYAIQRLFQPVERSNSNLSEKGILQRAQQFYSASRVESLTRDARNECLDNAIFNIDALLGIKPKQPDYHLLRGKYLASKEDYNNRSRSIGDFELALLNCSEDNVDLRYQILLERGITYTYLNRGDEAIRDYSEILKLDPRQYDARLRRADLYMNFKKDYHKGFNDLNEIIANLKEGDLLIRALKSRSAAAMLRENYQLAYDDAVRLAGFLPEDPTITTRREQAFAKLESQSKMRTMK